MHEYRDAPDVGNHFSSNNNKDKDEDQSETVLRVQGAKCGTSKQRNFANSVGTSAMIYRFVE